MILSKLTVFTAWVVLIMPVATVLLIWYYKREFPSFHTVNDCFIISSRDSKFSNNTYYCKVPQAYISVNMIVAAPSGNSTVSNVHLKDKDSSDEESSPFEFYFTMDTSVHVFVSESEKAVSKMSTDTLSEEHTISNVMSYPHAYQSKLVVRRSIGNESVTGEDSLKHALRRLESSSHQHISKKHKHKRNFVVPSGPVIDLYTLSYSSWLPYFALAPPHPHPRATAFGTEHALVWNTSAFGSHSFSTELFVVVEVRTSQMLTAGSGLGRAPASVSVQVVSDDPLVEEVLGSLVISLVTLGCLGWFCVALYQRGLHLFTDSVAKSGGMPLSGTGTGGDPSAGASPLTERSMLVSPSIRNVSGLDTARAVLYHTEPEQLFGAALLAFLVLYQGGLGNLRLLTVRELHSGAFWSRFVTLAGLQGMWMCSVLMVDSLQFCSTATTLPAPAAAAARKSEVRTAAVSSSVAASGFPERHYGSAGPSTPPASAAGPGTTPDIGISTTTPLSDYPEYLSFRGQGFEEEEAEEPMQRMRALYCDCSVPNIIYNCNTAKAYCSDKVRKWYRGVAKCFSTNPSTVASFDYSSLRPSHPFSVHFVEFASPKAVYFLVSCGVILVMLFVKSLALYFSSSAEGVRSSVTMTDISTDSDGYWWFLRHAEQNSSILLEQDKPWSRQFLDTLAGSGGESKWERQWHEDLQVFVSFLDYACSLVFLASQVWWGYAFIFSCIVTARVLRTKRFMTSRFNQLYFRLLSVQTITAAIGISLGALYVVYVATHSYWKFYGKSARLIIFGDSGAEGDEAVYSLLAVLEITWITLWAMANSLWDHPNRLSTMVYLSLICIVTVWLVSPSDAAMKCLRCLGLLRGIGHHRTGHSLSTRSSVVPVMLVTETELESLLMRTQAQPAVSLAAVATPRSRSAVQPTRFQHTHRSQLRSLFRKYLSRQRYMKDSRVLLNSARSGQHHHHHHHHGSDAGVAARDTEPFCLEMACKLLECSTQAYSLDLTETSADTDAAALEEPVVEEAQPLLSPASSASSSAYRTPATGPTVAPFSPPADRPNAESSGVTAPTLGDDGVPQTPPAPKPRPVLDPLGLRMVNHFENSSTSVGGYVAVSTQPLVQSASDPPRPKSELIVVCFRGTATHTNLITDLAFQQTPLPNLTLSKSYFEAIADQLGTPCTARGEKKVQTGKDGGYDRDDISGSPMFPNALVRNPSMRYSTSKRRSERFQALLEKDSSRRESEHFQLLRPDSFSTGAAGRFSGDEGDDEEVAEVEAELDAVSVTSSHSSSEGSEDEPDLPYYYDSDSGGEEALSVLVDDGSPDGSASRRRRGAQAFDPAAELSACWCFSWRCLEWCAKSLPWLCREFSPRVHSGFWEAYISIRNDLMRCVTAVMLRRYIGSGKDKSLSGGCGSVLSGSAPPLLRVYCTGHSMGGALATFASMDLSINMYAIVTTVIKAVNRAKLRAKASVEKAKSGNGSGGSSGGGGFGTVVAMPSHYAVIKEPLITVYSFGSPRMGNGPFAALVSHCLNPRMSASSSDNKHSHTNNYRVVMDGDLVPMVPKQLICSQTIGNWKHCGTPVLMDDDAKGNLVINPSVLELQMLRRHNTGTVSRHLLSCYRTSLHACFSPDALRHYLKANMATEPETTV